MSRQKGPGSSMKSRILPWLRKPGENRNSNTVFLWWEGFAEVPGRRQSASQMGTTAVSGDMNGTSDSDLRASLLKRSLSTVSAALNLGLRTRQPFWRTISSRIPKRVRQKMLCMSSTTVSKRSFQTTRRNACSPTKRRLQNPIYTTFGGVS